MTTQVTLATGSRCHASGCIDQGLGAWLTALRAHGHSSQCCLSTAVSCT
jgi:hypothetical protein